MYNECTHTSIVVPIDISLVDSRDSMVMVAIQYGDILYWLL